MVSVQILALAVALSNGGETVLLDFHAPWCAPCRSMDSTVDTLEQAGYPVRKVNIDRERSLAVQFGVDSIPCFVLLVNGQEAGRLKGAVRRDELADLFAKAGVGPHAGQRQVARGQSPDPPAETVAVAGQRDSNPFIPGREAQGGLAHTPTPFSVGAPPTGQNLIQRSARLTIADPKGSSYGSGTLIDSRGGEALVLTCGHIFRDSQGKGQISVDLFGSQAAQKLPGKLVAYDLKNDIGLVSIRTPGPVEVATVAPKGYRIAKGDRVTTVGCNNGGPATALDTRITALDKFLGPPNLQVAGLPVQGRSGGGLFSAEGHVIGVCNAADPADNEGLYAALASIHNQLDQLGLASVYQNPKSPAPSAATLAGAGRMPGPAGEPRFASATSGRDSPAGQFPARAAGLSGLSASEQAALAEVQKRGDGAEVICIVRSLSNPQAKSEVIMLDRASSAFLQQLSSDRQAQDARHLTSLRKQ